MKYVIFVCSILITLLALSKADAQLFHYVTENGQEWYVTDKNNVPPQYLNQLVKVPYVLIDDGEGGKRKMSFEELRQLQRAKNQAARR